MKNGKLSFYTLISLFVLVVANLTALCQLQSNTFAPSSQSKPIANRRGLPGAIQLLPGYIHIPRQGMDTLVGTISNQKEVVINYDIGDLAGNVAQGYSRKETIWHKEYSLKGKRVQMTFTKTKMLFVHFDEGSANFSAKIHKPEDMIDILWMLRTYK